jgi:hypothetical protein
VPLAFIRHSCRPNAYVSFEGNKLIVRAKEDIADANDVTIAKGNHHMVMLLKERRQSELALHYGITCDCDRCQAGDQPEEIADLKGLKIPTESAFNEELKVNPMNPDLEVLSNEFAAGETGQYMKQMTMRIKYEGVTPELTEEMFNQAVNIMDFVPKCADDKVVLKFLIEKLREMIPVTHGPGHPRIRMKTLEPMLSHKCWKQFEQEKK